MHIPTDKTKKLKIKTEKTQEEYSRKVITKDILPDKIRKICGVDVSYKNDIAFCSSVIFDLKTMKEIDHVDSKLKTEHGYLPGYFVLRESNPILENLKMVKTNYDILLIDGHGQLHPRRCGLACHIGITLQKPTIGVAKKLLCGKLRLDNEIELDEKILGQSIESKNKRIFISVGNMITLATAAKIIKKTILNGKWYPEPLYLADKYSKKLRKNFIK